MISLFFMVATQSNMAPINIPYQAHAAFIAYTECVGAHFDVDVSTSSPAEILKAHTDAITQCRETRARELERGLAAVGDQRTILAPEFRNRLEARAAVIVAFDRFDVDFIAE